MTAAVAVIVAVVLVLVSEAKAKVGEIWARRACFDANGQSWKERPGAVAGSEVGRCAFPIKRELLTLQLNCFIFSLLGHFEAACNGSENPASWPVAGHLRHVKDIVINAMRYKASQIPKPVTFNAPRHSFNNQRALTSLAALSLTIRPPTLRRSPLECHVCFPTSEFQSVISQISHFPLIRLTKCAPCSTPSAAFSRPLTSSPHS